MGDGSEVVVALDMGGTKLAAGIGTSTGDIKSPLSEATRHERGAADVLSRGIALAQGVHDRELAAGGHVVGVGVSTMGLTRPTHVDLAPNVPDWSNLSIPAALTKAFPGLPVTIDNDVKAATLAEMTWGALIGVNYGIYLNLGTGVAAGFVVAGELFRGEHGAAGEVGYLLPYGRREPQMAAQGHAPVEELLGGRGVGERLSDLIGRQTAVSEFVERSHRDDSAREVLDDVWQGIAVMAANLCIALDPSALVVGGGYMRAETSLLDKLRDLVDQAVPYPPEVVRAHFGADASLRGAAALALHHAGCLPATGTVQARLPCS
jgi:glucokinase